MNKNVYSLQIKSEVKAPIEEPFLHILENLGSATAQQISDYCGIKNRKNGAAVVKRIMDRLVQKGYVKTIPNP